ncbi:MAG: hypothetical protein E7627_04850 [Ruminococcaceae bacterium]|nr:hypothetical protein [Oscillospiraceae bacterium]
MNFMKAFDDRIERELESQEDYFEGNDKQLFYEMLAELDSNRSYKMRTFTELHSAVCPSGAGHIIVKYINRFENELAKSRLILRLYTDKVPNRDRIIMDLYHKYRESKYYLHADKGGIQMCICMDYDNAFYKMKSKKLLPELIEISKSIAETRRLSVTYGMIMKKWAPPEMEEIMVGHLLNRTPSKLEMGFADGPETDKRFYFDLTQSRFCQIRTLSYFPSERNHDLILTYADHEDKDLSKYAKKTAEIMAAKLTPLGQ